MPNDSIKVIRGVRLAVFDLDGTLFDSAGLWDRIDVEFLEKRGHAPTDEYRLKIAALGNREVARFTVGYYGLDDTPEELMREWSEMAIAAYEHDIKLLPHAKEYLEGCRARGIRLVAATSLDRALAEAGLKGNGIFELFERIFTADEMGMGKTDPKFYAEVAKLSGVEPAACVAFDDLARAVHSASLAGMTAVAVRGVGGYRDGEDIAKCGADLVIDGFLSACRLEGE